MKLMILADLHLHAFEEFASTVIHEPTGLPINSRLNDQLLTLRLCIQEAHSMGCRYLVVAGDIHHKRNALATEVQFFAYELFRWIVKELKWEVYLMTGNHDQLDREGKIHTLYHYQDLCTVIDYAVELEIGGVSCDFIPYTESFENLEHLLVRACMNDPVELLFMHAGIEGAFIGPIEYRIKTPVTLDLIDSSRFKHVIVGHYHKPQALSDNVIYVGSPYQLNRAEAGDDKRYLVYDSDTKELTSHWTNAKEFQTIDAATLAVSTGLPDHYYDVELPPTGMIDDFQSAASGRSVKFIRHKTAKVSEKRIELSERMTDEQLLVAYLLHNQANPSYLQIGRAILNNVTQITCPYTSIELLSLEINNFMAISHAKVKLNRPGEVIAVMGDNQDSPGYDSNGAGKSTVLPESLFWCFFNKTARKLPADKVINRWKKRDCFVKVVAKLDNNKLEVIRFRKYKKRGGTGLHLKLNGVDITEGTQELTELKLASLLGIDYTTFSSVVAFSPDNLRFVGSTDTNQKQVLDSILQTRRFTAALELAKSLHSELKANSLNSARELSSTNGLLESARATQADYVTRNQQFEQREASRLKRIVEQIDKLIIDKNDARDLVESTQTKLNDFCDSLAKLEAVAPNVEQAQQAYNKAVEMNATAKANHEAADRVVHDFQRALDGALDQAGKPCPTCGVPVANTGKLIAQTQSLLRQAQSAIKITALQATRTLEHKNAQAQVLEVARNSVNKINEQQREIERVRRALAQAEVRVVNLSRSILDLDLSKDDVPVNDFDTLIPQINTKVQVLEAELAKLEKEVAKFSKQIEVMAFWVKAYGNAGIRSFLLDQILPDLTQYANEFSNALTGGGTLIEFSSYNEDTMKDKFKIEATNEQGSDIYEGNSSGEKRRVDICVMFALFRIANSRTRFNIILLDEVLDTLDRSGLEAVPDTLQKLAIELNLAVYVTSHTELNSMIHNSIVVEKHNGYSTVTEA